MGWGIVCMCLCDIVNCVQGGVFTGGCVAFKIREWSEARFVEKVLPLLLNQDVLDRCTSLFNRDQLRCLLKVHINPGSKGRDMTFYPKK